MTIQPLLLAAEFIQHAVLITLIGVILVEYIRHGRNSKTTAIRRELVFLLGATVLVAISATASYFANPNTSSYYWLISFFAPVFVWYGMRRLMVLSVKVGFCIFVVLELFTIGQCALHFLFNIHPLTIEAIQNFLNTAQVFLLYFFVIKHCILSAKQ